jgi:hypothetical protein
MQIRNWAKHQHYKGRRPPWVKLYRELLDDEEFHVLSPQSAKVLILLWLLAAEDQTMQGLLPNKKKIAFRLRVSEKLLESSLSELSHWVVQDASDMLVERKQLVSSESESETETETETENRGREQRTKATTPLRATVVNDEFFLELKKNPAYAHIDMERENGKMDAWLALPANRNRIKTRKFVLNWLNKIESPLNVAVPQETALEKFLRRGS